MSESKLLKNCAATLLNDTQAAAFSMAAECTGLKHSALIRQYIVRGLIQDQFLAHPMAKYADAKKAG
jgi:hypothetical protein